MQVKVEADMGRIIFMRTLSSMLILLPRAYKMKNFVLATLYVTLQYFSKIVWSSCDKTHMVFVDFQVFTYNSRCVQADNTQCPTTIQTTEGD